MMMNTTMFEASGVDDLGQSLDEPEHEAVLTMAPKIEPIPPMTTTANTTITSDEPIRGLT